MNGFQFQMIREMNDFSKERMAEIMDASVSDIEDWENGIFAPADWQLQNLSYEIFTSVEDLKEELEIEEGDSIISASNFTSIDSNNSSVVGDLAVIGGLLGAAKLFSSIANRHNKNRGQNSYKYNEIDSSAEESATEVFQPMIQSVDITRATPETKKHHPILVGVLIVVLLALGCGYYYYQLPATKLSSEDCVGKQYSAIVRNFEMAGFENVLSVPMNDLSYEELELNGQVDCVDIGTHTRFSANQKIIGENDVSVFYHSPKIVKVGYSSKEFEGQQFKDVVALLNEHGFYDIEIVEKPDIRFGIFNKEGSVSYVQIGKEKKYDENTEYPINTKIQIEYHTAYKKQ